MCVRGRRAMCDVRWIEYRVFDARLCMRCFLLYLKDKSPKNLMFEIIASQNKWVSACVWHKIVKNLMKHAHSKWVRVRERRFMLIDDLSRLTCEKVRCASKTWQFYCLVLHTLFRRRKCFRMFLLHPLLVPPSRLTWAEDIESENHEYVYRNEVNWIYFKRFSSGIE